MALTPNKGAATGVPFTHAQDSGGTQMSVMSLPVETGSLTFVAGAAPGMPFLHAQTEDGMQVPVVALHPESPGNPGGGNGTPGANGWTPTIAVESYEGAAIMKVTDWTGGTGTKPPSNVYIGPNGFVSSPNDATNIRGFDGADGEFPDAPADGRIYGRKDGAWVLRPVEYSMYLNALGGGSLILQALVVPAPCTLNAADFSVTVSTAATTPASALDIKRNGVSIGSISATGVVTFTAPNVLASRGDRLSIHAPATSDATWDGIYILATHPQR